MDQLQLRPPMASGIPSVGTLRPMMPDQNSQSQQPRPVLMPPPPSSQPQAPQLQPQPLHAMPFNSNPSLNSSNSSNSQAQPQAQAQAPAQAQPPAPAYVLYVSADCVNSFHLLVLLANNPIPRIYVQDTQYIQQLPHWLNGVPTLADTHYGLIYRGSDAMVLVRQLVEKHSQELQALAQAQAQALAAQAQGQGQGQVPGGGGGGGQSSQMSTRGPEAAGASAWAMEQPLPDNSHRYKEQGRGVPDSTLQELQSLRDAQTPKWAIDQKS